MTLAKIVQMGEPDGTLATNYAALTGRAVATAFADFKAAVAAAGGPTSDNPFNTPTPPFPPAAPIPPSPPAPSPPGPPPPLPSGPTLAEVEACDQDVFTQLKRTFRRTRGAAQVLDAALVALEGEHAALWQQAAPKTRSWSMVPVKE